MKLFKLPFFALVVFMAGCATGGGEQVDTGTVAEAPAEVPADEVKPEVKVNELASLATGALLESAKSNVIEAEELAARACEKKTITKAEVTRQPSDDNNMWIEQWTVNRCGKLVWYNLRFVPKADGDPTIILTRVNRQAVIIEESRSLN
ncbi:hypothetical protein MNBD_NITROSPINAE01-135 [hydrothermal vent metagenome]|uniref:Lipoprotein n=1 Tax=hydrothermal vent metagenome TaxID=652676 RepID=A0A3B1CCG2_9ZZZZ